MSSFLVLYASTHGQTRKIAERLAEGVRAAGHSADLSDVRSGEALAPAGHDMVIAGGSIHAGHHQRELVDWARKHHGELNSLPSAFFSVCLTAAEEDPEAAEASKKYVADFLAETGWKPARTASFAGALQYLEYDFFTRVLMRLLMHKGNHPTDASRDYDYTDWNAVEAFAGECAGLAASG